MANIKITDLTAYTAPADTDVLPIVDVGADVTKKVSVGELVGTIAGDVDVATDGTSSIAAGAIVDADVNASAAIAGTKISPNFGSQAVSTTGLISANGRVSFPLGSAAAPSLYPGSDTNTGIYSPGADQLALSTNGTGRLFVDASGNVGVGAVSSFNLGVTGAASANGVIRVEGGSGATTNAVLDLTGRGSDNNYTNCEIRSLGAGIGSGGTLTFSVDATNQALQERLRITSAGLVGIGTSSPQNKLTVDTDIGIYRSSSDPTLNFSVGGTISAPTKTYRLLIDDSDSDKFQLRDGSTARLTVDGSGNVGIGITSPSTMLQIGNSATAGLSVAMGGVGFQTIFRNSAYEDNYITQGATGSTRFRNHNGTEYGRWDSSGRLLVGTSTYNGNGIAVFQGNTSGATGAGAIDIRRAATRPTAADTAIGYLRFMSTSQTSASNHYAAISAWSDGASTSDGDIPGRLVFSTTADGASSPTERLRITSAGVLQVADAGNIAVGTTTGTKIGTATTQKLGFFNKTPVVQPAAVADATDAASVITQLNALLARMRDLGLIAT